MNFKELLDELVPKEGFAILDTKKEQIVFTWGPDAPYTLIRLSPKSEVGGLGNTLIEQVPATNPNPPAPLPSPPIEQRVHSASKEEIIEALVKANWNQRVAARLLGYSKTSLYPRIRLFGGLFALKQEFEKGGGKVEE